ncbi:MAG: cysteine synthase A [Muribaculaceae bacterium]|nr:cysteine synthase A [Muribaculaceae bacterium]
MKKVADNITELIGRTPLLRLHNYGKALKLDALISAKLESFNPGGSVKDRVALSMIEDAESRGVIKPGSVIIEPTSGNTGIGLALVAAAKGYEVILTMPETMSIERRRLLQAYGAKLILTPGAAGMKGAIEMAERVCRDTRHGVILGQFVNPANPAVHERTTGPELWQQTNGEIDYFVAGVGTGGTITGVGHYLKKCNPEIKIIAVEPADSPVLSGGNAGPHRLQGIGAGFVPEIYDPKTVDEIIKIATPEAINAARMVAVTEGVLSGFSAGAALFAATRVARRPEAKGKNIVVLLPDTGDRYLSTDLFAEADHPAKS